MGFNCLKSTEPLRGDSLLFTTKFPRSSWYSFIQPRKNERLSQTLNHPVVLNLGPLDWESSAPTTRPLLHAGILRILSFFEIQIQYFKVDMKISFPIIKSTFKDIYFFGALNWVTVHNQTEKYVEIVYMPHDRKMKHAII